MQNALVRNTLAAIFGILVLIVLSIYQNVLQATSRANVVDFVEINTNDTTIFKKIPLPLAAQDILELGEAEEYVITFKSPAGDGNQYFYFPQMDASIKLSAEDGVEFSNLQSVIMSDPFRQRSIAFQTSLKTDQVSNSIRLLINRTELSPIANKLILSKIYISQSQNLLDAIQSRLLIEDLMRPFMLGIQVILIVYMGVIGVVLEVAILRWFALFFATATFLTSGYIVSLLGLPAEAFRFIFLIFSGLAGLSLIGAAYALRGIVLGKKFLVFMIAIFAANAVMALSQEVQPFTQYIILNAPISVIGLFYFVAVLMRQSFASYKVEKIFLILSVGVLLAGWTHDVLVQGGVIEAGILIGTFSRMGVAISALGYVIILQIQNHHAAQQLLQLQGIQLMEKDTIIKSQRARELEDARLLAIHEERQNLNRELHDGVSSNLVSVISMLKREKASHDVISLAQLTIRELRSVISATSVRDADLGFFLSIFRENYLRFYDLEEAQITVSLDPDALDQKVTAHRGMQVLRILQEAFANIVKHAPNAQVSLILEKSPGGGVSVSVSNRTERMERTQNVGGLGLINMRTRAQRAGCPLQISETSSEFTIKLEIPH